MARFHSLQTALAAFVAFAGVAQSQAPITSCPTQVKTSTAPSGKSYSVCASTDYRGPSAQVLQDVSTLQACIQKCDASGGSCVRAVYDNENAICHFKSNQAGALTWVQDSQFSTIVSSTSRAGGTGQGAPPPANPGTGATGAALTRCPTGDQSLNTVTGAQFLICQNTDFRGDSASVTPAASTESCAELCSQTATCMNAVFDKVNSQCHVKADPRTTTLTWVQDSTFDVIRLNMGALGGGVAGGGGGAGTGGGFVPPPATAPAPAAPPKQDPDPDVDPALIGFLLGGLGAPPPPQQAPPPKQQPPPKQPPPPTAPPPGFPGFGAPPTTAPPPTAPPPGFFGIPFVKREDPDSLDVKTSRDGKVARKFVA